MLRTLLILGMTISIASSATAKKNTDSFESIATYLELASPDTLTLKSKPTKSHIQGYRLYELKGAQNIVLAAIGKPKLKNIVRIEVDFQKDHKSHEDFSAWLQSEFRAIQKTERRGVDIWEIPQSSESRYTGSSITIMSEHGASGSCIITINREKGGIGFNPRKREMEKTIKSPFVGPGVSSTQSQAPLNDLEDIR